MLHERICRSEKLGKVSFGAEACWVRVLTLADDNGNIEFDLDVIRSLAFVKRRVTDDEVSGWLRELIDVRSEGNGGCGLLLPYEAGGKRFLHIAGFEEYQVIPRGKYPQVECLPHPETMGRVLKDHGEPILPDKWKDRWAHVAPGKDGELQGNAGAVKGMQGPSENRNEVNRNERKEAAAFAATYLTVPVSLDKDLAEAFPWVNRQAEYRKAEAWLRVNPAKRPKKYDRFIHNWMRNIRPPAGAGTGMSREELDARRNKREVTEADEKLMQRLKKKPVFQ